MSESLNVDRLSVRYGAVVGLRDASFSLGPGRIVAVTGPNGAGKSSMVMAIAGGLPGAQVRGSIRYGSHELLGMSPERINALGIACVPEGRRIFSHLTVEENLLVSAHLSRSSRTFRERLDALASRFPALGEFRRKPAGLLSGGQLQQLAIGRALIQDPQLILVDEPSIGLAPNLVTEILAAIASLRAEGTSVVLVEQNAARAREIADDWLPVDKGQASPSGEDATWKP